MSYTKINQITYPLNGEPGQRHEVLNTVRNAATAFAASWEIGNIVLYNEDVKLASLVTYADGTASVRGQGRAGICSKVEADMAVTVFISCLAAMLSKVKGDTALRVVTRVRENKPRKIRAKETRPRKPYRKRAAKKV